jgi:hypothetical protein
VGTPRGGVLEIDLDDERASEYSVAAAPVSGLAVTPTGQLVVGDRAGQVAVMDVPGDAGRDTGPAAAAAARARVEQFLAATTELPDDADLDESLVLHDGRRSWSPDDLDTVTTAGDTDPTWLRLQAAINTHRQSATNADRG